MRPGDGISLILCEILLAAGASDADSGQFQGQWGVLATDRYSYEAWPSKTCAHSGLEGVGSTKLGIYYD